MSSPKYNVRPVYSWSTPQVKDMAFYLLIIVIVLLCVYIYWKVSDGSVKCMASPIQYGIGNLVVDYNQSVTCSCSSPGASQILVYTKDNVSVKNLQSGFFGG